MTLVKNNWLPFLVGIVFALWVLPILTSVIGARKSPAAAN